MIKRRVHNLSFSLIACLSLNIFSQNEIQIETYKIEYVLFSYPAVNESEEKFSESSFSFTSNELVLLKKADSDIEIDASTLLDSFSTERDLFTKNITLDFNFEEQITNDNRSKVPLSIHLWDFQSESLEILETFRRRAVRRDDITILQQGSWIQAPNGSIPLKRTLIEDKSLVYINFYKDRYLHLDINAFLNHEVIEEALFDKNFYTKSVYGNLITVSENEITSIKNNSQLLPSKIKSKFWMAEDRRVFNEDVHFFDHPAFGLLVSVKRVYQ
mgnify:FL=1